MTRGFVALALLAAACGGSDDGHCTLPAGANAVTAAPYSVIVPPPGEWNVALTGATTDYSIKLQLNGDQGIFTGGPPHAGNYPVDNTPGCGACLTIAVAPLPGSRFVSYLATGQIEATAVSQTGVVATVRDLALSGDGPLDGCALEDMTFVSAN